MKHNHVNMRTTGRSNMGPQQVKLKTDLSGNHDRTMVGGKMPKGDRSGHKVK